MFGKRNKQMVEKDAGRSNVQTVDLWEDFDSLFNTFKRDMNRLFWDPLTLSPSTGRAIRRGWMIPMDLEDRGEKFVLTADLPGLTKDQAKISIEDEMLTVSVGSDESKEKKEEGKYILKERRSFSSSRSIRIPEKIREDEVTARMKDGVLQVELPKKVPKKKVTKEIQIK